MTTEPPADQRRRLQQVLDDIWSKVAAPGAPVALLTAEVNLVTAGGVLRLGRDQDGLPHVLVPLPGSGSEQDLRGTSGVSVKVRHLLLDDEPTVFLDLACLRADLIHVFASLTVDVCARLAQQPAEPLEAVRAVMDEWRALLERERTAWTRARCAGLFAELVVLRMILASNSHALDAWTGPYGAAHDFRSPGRAIEVKATAGAEGRLVRIHGSDQLEQPSDGELHLAWFRLEDGRAGKGESVRAVLEAVAGEVGNPRRWVEYLDLLGLPPTEHSEVDRRAFVVVEQRWYGVGPGFPRIVPTSFAAGAVPAGVGAVEYLVDLDAVPLSWAVDDPRGVTDRLAASA
jgi:hypothetical protein